MKLKNLLEQFGIIKYVLSLYLGTVRPHYFFNHSFA